MADSDFPSTVPGAKAGLLKLLQGLVGLKGVTVDYGDPGVDRIELEHVFLGGTGEDEQKWAPTGQLKRDEQYGIELYVHVAKPGLTQQQATERGYELLAVIASALRPLARTPTKVEPHLYSIELKPRRLREYVIAEGCAAFLENEVACKARI